MKRSSHVNGQLSASSLEEINERWRKAHASTRIRKGRKTKNDIQRTDSGDTVTGGIPIWHEAVSLKQDYRCKCRDTIKIGTYHALNLETDQRLCMACALDMGLPRSLFWSYWRKK